MEQLGDVRDPRVTLEEEVVVQLNFRRPSWKECLSLSGCWSGYEEGSQDSSSGQVSPLGLRIKEAFQSGRGKSASSSFGVLSKRCLRVFRGRIVSPWGSPQRLDSESRCGPGQPYWLGLEIPTKGNGDPHGRVAEAHARLTHTA